MKRFSTFPLVDHELNRLDENNVKLAAQVQELTERLKKVEERKKPGPKPK